jgi:hypothetical protein
MESATGPQSFSLSLSLTLLPLPPSPLKDITNSLNVTISCSSNGLFVVSPVPTHPTGHRPIPSVVVERACHSYSVAETSSSSSSSSPQSHRDSRKVDGKNQSIERE